MSNGKGDTPRRVDPHRYATNYAYIFGTHTTNTDNRQTPKSAMQGYNDLLRKFDPTTDIAPEEPK